LENNRRKSKKGTVFFLILFTILILLLGGVVFVWSLGGEQKIIVAQKLSDTITKATRFLPLEGDLKKEMEVANDIFQEISKVDDVSRRYLLLLQNNMELRPGGGFLGQYVVVVVKNGRIEKIYFEDANLLDQRIRVKVTPPYPLTRKLQIKKWKFRDSNFSPDFPENVKQAKRFFGYSGRNNKFDGVFAINATVLNHLLAITGPITLKGGYTYNSENAISKLEEQVEKPYLFNENLNTQNRKWIMKRLTEALKDRLVSFKNIPQLIDFAREELSSKNVQLNFQNPDLQKKVAEVKWSGEVNKDWDGDFLMFVDANLGALKSDFFVKRSIDYNVDLSVDPPLAIVDYKYDHQATRGDWRTSDYHSYLRLYIPDGSKFLKRTMVTYPVVRKEFNKTYFGVYLDAVMGRVTTAHFEYNLPTTIKDDYRLLIQKQSGLESLPVHVHLKDKDGKEYDYTGEVKNELLLEFRN